MLKKHNVQEQSIEDYADTIQQLSRTARQLGEEKHPERYASSFSQQISAEVIGAGTAGTQSRRSSSSNAVNLHLIISNLLESEEEYKGLESATVDLKL